MTKLYGSVQVTKILRVHDGDTFTASILPWPPIVGQAIIVRISGIDTPEIRDRNFTVLGKAQAAKKFLEDILRSGKVIILDSIQRDKFFRINARVMVDGQDVAQALINAGHARPYQGGKRLPWS